MSFPVFASHADGTNETIAAAHMNAVQNAASMLNRQLFSVSDDVVMSNGEVVLRVKMPVAMSFAANFAGSSGDALTAPGASLTLTVRKRSSGATTYSTIGTVVFGTGATPIAPAFATTGGAIQPFAAGDELSIIGPATADTAFTSWAFTLVAYYP